MNIYKNRWGIPLDLAKLVFERDKKCIYCHCELIRNGQKSIGSWEHIINDAKIICPENIARCCRSCNSSKGTKSLSQWLTSSYCVSRNIKIETVADIVRIHVQKFGS